MNFIHPFRVQALGPAEFNHLKAQTPEGFRAEIDRLFTADLAVVIVANNKQVPPYLAELADRFNTALFSSGQPRRTSSKSCASTSRGCWPNRRRCTACFSTCWRSAC